MKISKIRLNDFRCFDQVEMNLGCITVLLGPNNSGKSSLLRAISAMQAGTPVNEKDIRAGKSAARIVLNCDALDGLQPMGHSIPPVGQELLVVVESAQKGTQYYDSAGQRFQHFSDLEPSNCIVPYYSRRKVHGYSEDVRGHYARGAFNMNFLASKLSRITVPSFPGHREYEEGCEKILGFTLGAVPSDNGLRPGKYLPDGSALTLDNMGDGVPSIVGLLIELVTANNKVFLIEEPENDLHPSALKALLEVILKSSHRNQFIVSTHSNIVVQYLGGEPGSIFEVTPTTDDLPTSLVVQVEDTSVARINVLRKLGYALSDFDLWDGWVILEESSAERIVRDFLVPLFVPRLTSVRLLAANGVDDAEATYAALNRMVRFTHLEETYRYSTWVRLDGDVAGRRVVEQLRNTYSRSLSDQFGFFSRENFEEYYPAEFSDRVRSTLAISDRKSRRDAKKKLLDDVIFWLREDKKRAIEALANSAAEVIDFLRNVESSMRR